MRELRRSEVFDAGFFRVERVSLEGRASPVTLLRMPDWVMAVAVNPAGRFVLVRQHRFGIAAETVEPAGGLVDAGEAPAAAALRELGEETGYAGATAEPLGFTHPNPVLQDNRCHFFLVREAVQVGAPHADAEEVVAPVVMGRAEVEAALAEGRIAHALAELALRRALAVL
ncbi:NUDIX domain-containing protein [Nannocystis exedens]|uniref:GDP-mannose pyrophosphatase n=1 Tax=Nannocystis exedens TaxID=54 RepID=A0A1I1ZNH8_9BACT|nr:NUDIX hydrolase [Nannocystis exedens]PCC75417.1 NUDIX domain-containing protein [Nannocystis exedens]SFE32908.1 NUDIX domain-containing protein [Nannocystis exedens]